MVFCPRTRYKGNSSSILSIMITPEGGLVGVEDNKSGIGIIRIY